MNWDLLRWRPSCPWLSAYVSGPWMVWFSRLWYGCYYWPDNREAEADTVSDPEDWPLLTETSLAGNSGKLSWGCWIFLDVHGHFRLLPQDMVALRPVDLGRATCAPVPFWWEWPQRGVQGEACGQRTGLVGLHACLMARPRAPPEARAGPAAAPLPQQSISSSSWARCVQGSGTQALASAGHLHHRDQRHLSVCMGCSSGSFSVFPTPGPYSLPECLRCAFWTPASHLMTATFPRLLLHSHSCVRSGSGGFTWRSPSGSASQLAPEYTVQLLSKEGKTSNRLPRCAYSHVVMAFQLSGSFYSSQK